VSRALLVAVALAGSAATLARAPAAYADPTSDENDPAYKKAKRLTIEGRKLFDLGKFGPALAKFEAAYQAKPIAGLLFNIGQCHANLDEYDEAIFSFKKYLRLLPDAPNRDAVREYIDELEAEKAEKDKQSPNDVNLLAPDRDPDDGATGPTGPTGPVDAGPERVPFYKKWWFWGGVAAVAATGGVLILSSGGPPGTDLGNIDFGK
jgi:tetratricopeptide (TPR) repeat protein